MEKLEQALDTFINPMLYNIIISNPKDKAEGTKIKIRPVMIKGSISYQAEEFIGKQAFHKNMNQSNCIKYIRDMLSLKYRQAEISSKLGTGNILVSKKGSMTVKIKKNEPSDHASAVKIISKYKTSDVPDILKHNKGKKYILNEGSPIAFLEDLGVMNSEGKIISAKYDKFRQINRFLEFIEDVVSMLDKSKTSTIIDFGCGKSYLTFAMYYYLHTIKEYPIRIIGLDLKKDVIDHCNELAKKFGFDALSFYKGDIADYDGVQNVDMVVTLHACDTATDYALYKAIKWGAKIILSVPCCQHELNKQISCRELKPILKYGILKERISALLTDGIRAEILEYMGYKTQLLEFIDMEHTPKNILIRAVKDDSSGSKKKSADELEQLMKFTNADLTLYRLIKSEQK